MSNLMGEKVIVSEDVPHYLPEFKNPIYGFAVQQKLALRSEVIERLKAGQVPNGVAPLLKTIAPLATSEYDMITKAWLDNGEYILYENYRHALAFGDIVEAEGLDEHFGIGQIKNESGGRK